MADKTTQMISYVTILDEENARKLARSLVENRLAACVNIVKGAKSIHKWEDKIEEDSECMLTIKTDSSKSAEFTQFVAKNHPYDCPEVVAPMVSPKASHSSANSKSDPDPEWLPSMENEWRGPRRVISPKTARNIIDMVARKITVKSIKGKYRWYLPRKLPRIKKIAEEG